MSDGRGRTHSPPQSPHLWSTVDIAVHMSFRLIELLLHHSLLRGLVVKSYFRLRKRLKLFVIVGNRNHRWLLFDRDRPWKRNKYIHLDRRCSIRQTFLPVSRQCRQSRSGVRCDRMICICRRLSREKDRHSAKRSWRS